MTKQPEALRLADLLDAGENFYRESSLSYDFKLSQSVEDAADELRRLHEVNQELLEALKVLADESNGFSVSGVYFNEKCMGHKGLDMAYAAIAKATGEQP